MLYNYLHLVGAQYSWTLEKNYSIMIEVVQQSSELFIKIGGLFESVCVCLSQECMRLLSKIVTI